VGQTTPKARTPHHSEDPSIVNAALPGWLTLCAAGTVFAVMLSLGLLLGREQFTAALQRRMVLAAILFAVVLAVPALPVLFVKRLGLQGPHRRPSMSELGYLSGLVG